LQFFARALRARTLCLQNRRFLPANFDGKKNSDVLEVKLRYNVKLRKKGDETFFRSHVKLGSPTSFLDVKFTPQVHPAPLPLPSPPKQPPANIVLCAKSVKLGIRDEGVRAVCAKYRHIAVYFAEKCCGVGWGNNRNVHVTKLLPSSPPP